MQNWRIEARKTQRTRHREQTEMRYRFIYLLIPKEMCKKFNVLSFSLWGYVSCFTPIHSIYPRVKWYYREVINLLYMLRFLTGWFPWRQECEIFRP
jgi:hypothetical protein